MVSLKIQCFLSSKTGCDHNENIEQFLVFWKCFTEHKMCNTVLELDRIETEILNQFLAEWMVMPRVHGTQRLE